ncbi:MAG: hypothetical protein Q9M22_03410 [Mariprofundaceae bacterium]|nr:hypothetical protein [Mariprofundaceae bacterium]
MNLRKLLVFIASFWVLMLLSTPAIAAAELASSAGSHQVIITGFVTVLLMLLLIGFSLLMLARLDTSIANTVMFKASLGSAWAVLLFAMVGYGLMFGVNSTGLWGASLFFFTGDIGGSLLFYSVLAAVFVFISGNAVLGYLSYRIHWMVSLFFVLLFAVVGSWVWGEQGWLHAQGFIDIGGSTVIHSVAGWIVLAALIGLKKHADEREVNILPNTALSGMAIIFIWLGWLGLTLGTTLYGNHQLTEIALEHVLLNTLLAGCAGMIAASMASYMVNQTLDLSSIALGCIAGLVSISAGAAIMQPLFAILTGFIGGAVAIFSVLVLHDMRIYDRTAVISAHGLPGVWGTLAAGVFYTGDFFNPDRVLVQMMGMVAVFVFVFLVTWLLFFALRKIIEVKEVVN